MTEATDPPSPQADDDDVTPVPVADFVAGARQETESVDVRISLGIIRRFSEGLYSSPNKTFEELVSNSYDAGARRVWIYMPADLAASDASIVVCDDGISMDLDGLRELWMIGESRKRDRAAVAGRPPIGKFEIGKLATYVLANQLTYVVARDGVFRALTMDYSLVEGEMTDPHKLHLSVATLTEEEARETLISALEGKVEGVPEAVAALFGDSKPASWTAAILTTLKDPAHHIQRGRLRWVLRTAIPLSPEFTLFENDLELESSKIEGTELWRFICGRDKSLLAADPGGDRAPQTLNGVVFPRYRLPLAGIVSGEAALFADPLERGKSEELGRSHGFFVRVRGRLINLNDPEFSLGPELHHGTLTRLNMVVNADDLDALIASPRESLQESPQLSELKSYLLAIFNRARAELASNDAEDIPPLISKQGRIAEPPPALTQAPLRRMVRRAVAGETSIQQTLGITDDQLASARALVSDGEDLLELVLIEPSGNGPMVRFDPDRKAAVLNSDHPYVSNYLNVKGAAEPLRLMGLTELLTEAYMLDEDVRPDQVERVMSRRDAFLRELVKRYPRSASVIAQHLRDASNDEKALEDAVADALTVLGFDVTRVGGASDTDGIAVSRLGRRGGESLSYSFTYDAKSSGADAAKALEPTDIETGSTGRRRPAGSPRIRASTAQTSILKVHRTRAKAAHGLDVEPEFTLLVAPGFQGDGDEATLIHDVSESDVITPITVEDLARLVELFPIRAITPAVFKELMQKSRSPEASRAFVNEVEERAELPETPPVGELLKVLLDYSERKSAVTIDVLSTALYERSEGRYDIDPDTLDAVVRGLAALAPRGMYFDGKFVALNSDPATLVDELHASLDRYTGGIGEAYKQELESAKPVESIPEAAIASARPAPKASAERISPRKPTKK